MKIEINNDGLKLVLESENELGFTKLFKAYQLATGNEDELEINSDTENAPFEQKKDVIPATTAKRLAPDRGELVKCDVQCPLCGKTEVVKVRYKDYFTKCSGCGERLHLSAASSEYGVPNEKGFYYLATEKHLSAQERYEEKHGGIDANMFKKSEVEGVPDSTNTISEIVDYLDENEIEHKGITLKGKLLELVGAVK